MVVKYLSKKGFLNKILYGDNSRPDFVDSMLPATRRKQFWYIIKNNWVKLLLLNLITFLFFIPVVIHSIVSLYIYNDKFANLSEVEMLANLLPLNLSQYGVLALIFPFSFIGLAGAAFVIRKMLFDEVVDIKTDFIKGIKYSFKSFMLIGLLFGILLLLFNYSLQFILLSNMTPFVQFVVFFLLIMLAVFFIINMMYVINLSTLYYMKFSDILKTSFYLSLKSLFRNLCLFLLAFVPVFIWSIFSYVYLKLVTIGILLLFGFSYILLMFGEMAMHMFDTYINILSNSKSLNNLYKLACINSLFILILLRMLLYLILNSFFIRKRCLKHLIFPFV